MNFRFALRRLMKIRGSNLPRAVSPAMVTVVEAVLLWRTRYAADGNPVKMIKNRVI